MDYGCGQLSKQKFATEQQTQTVKQGVIMRK